jgi:hypothetical protein
MATIYLSATYQDLKAYRDAVYHILRMLRHDVISMEDYVATDAYPLHKCLADVAASGIYLGLLGWRYGYIPRQHNPEHKSITELEYRQAGTSGLPRLVFLADSDAPWPDEFRDAGSGDGDDGQRIADFRAEVANATLVSHFRTPDHLVGLVSVAVQRCLDERPATKPSVGGRLREAKRQALDKRLRSLLEDYQAATEQLAYVLSAVDRSRLSRQVDSLEKELAEIERQLNEM